MHLVLEVLEGGLVRENARPSHWQSGVREIADDFGGHRSPLTDELDLRPQRRRLAPSETAEGCARADNFAAARRIVHPPPLGQLGAAIGILPRCRGNDSQHGRPLQHAAAGTVVDRAADEVHPEIRSTGDGAGRLRRILHGTASPEGPVNGPGGPGLGRALRQGRRLCGIRRREGEHEDDGSTCGRHTQCRTGESGLATGESPQHQPENH